jgi:Helix-turn-helix domain
MSDTKQTIDPESLPRVLNAVQAAELLGIKNVDVLRKQTRLGQVPGQRVGGRYRYSSAALLAWLARPLFANESASKVRKPKRRTAVPGVPDRLGGRF